MEARLRGEVDDLCGDGLKGAAGQAEAFVKGGQVGGNLRGAEGGCADLWEERAEPTSVAGVIQAESVIGSEAGGTSLPTGGGSAAGGNAEDVMVGGSGEVELVPDLVGAHGVDVVLPGEMVVAVDTGFETEIGDATHDGGVASSDMGPGKESAVEQSFPSVVASDMGPGDLGEETGPEDAANGATRMIGAEREEEGGGRVVPTADIGQRENAIPGATIGVDINLESDRAHVGKDYEMETGQQARKSGRFRLVRGGEMARVRQEVQNGPFTRED